MKEDKSFETVSRDTTNVINNYIRNSKLPDPYIILRSIMMREKNFVCRT